MKHDVVGKKFGRLTVVSEAEPRRYASGASSRMVMCQCECGTIKPVLVSSLIRGGTKSCGCLLSEVSKAKQTKHGDGHSRLNGVWSNMKQRCYNPSRVEFDEYGKRGITVCDEWKNDYAAFRDWALANGYDPQAKHGQCTIERIDVNGNYEPSNCRIATQKEQCNNLRKNILIEIDGRTQTLKQWADESGLDEAKIRYRYRHGYTGSDLLKPHRVTKKQEKEVKA
jgi:hypothetical protein